jgi:hypothetical protein
MGYNRFSDRMAKYYSSTKDVVEMMGSNKDVSLGILSILCRNWTKKTKFGKNC